MRTVDAVALINRGSHRFASCPAHRTDAPTACVARSPRNLPVALSLPAPSGVLGAEDAATVHAALHPLSRPLADDDRTAPQRHADALVEVCRLALRTDQLPDDGGEPPQLTVTVAYQPLAHPLGTAVTDTGQRLSAATVRRLACDARILPVVLGGASQILDIGRARRLATGPLRPALHVRDRGCAFPDCDRPPRWTGGHHTDIWRMLTRPHCNLFPGLERRAQDCREGIVMRSTGLLRASALSMNVCRVGDTPGGVRGERVVGLHSRLW